MPNPYRAVNTPSRLHKTNQLMLYREIISVYSTIHTQHTHTLCGQNVECFLGAFAKLRKNETISFVM
jgi:hypothetical protein